VAIDILTETVLPFAAAARSIPRLRAEKPVNPATLWRWASHGLRGVKLETIRCGGTRCTSREALKRFFAALAGESAPALTPRQQSERTSQELDAIGI
jgi:hypothetical protein